MAHRRLRDARHRYQVACFAGLTLAYTIADSLLLGLHLFDKIFVGRVFHSDVRCSVFGPMLVLKFCQAGIQKFKALKNRTQKSIVAGATGPKS